MKNKIDIIFILMAIALVLAGVSMGILIGKYAILNDIKLRAINEDYENEVILEINGALYENNESGKFDKYFVLSEEEK